MVHEEWPRLVVNGKALMVSEPLGQIPFDPIVQEISFLGGHGIG